MVCAINIIYHVHIYAYVYNSIHGILWECTFKVGIKDGVIPILHHTWRKCTQTAAAVLPTRGIQLLPVFYTPVVRFWVCNIIRIGIRINLITELHLALSIHVDCQLGPLDDALITSFYGLYSRLGTWERVRPWYTHRRQSLTAVGCRTSQLRRKVTGEKGPVTEPEHVTYCAYTSTRSFSRIGA